MSKMRMKAKRLMAAVMAAAMMLSSMPTSVFATDGSAQSSCTHHTEHTVDCGYEEGANCAHLCSTVNGCIVAEESCAHVHDETCGYAEAVEGAVCTHQHDESCQTLVTECLHAEHDSDCGYKAASDCAFVCEECKKETVDDETDEGSEQTEETIESDPVTALFDTLMAFQTYEELGDYMDNMSEEEYRLMAQFSDEQNAALQARVDELSEYEAEVLDSKHVFTVQWPSNFADEQKTELKVIRNNNTLVTLNSSNGWTASATRNNNNSSYGNLSVTGAPTGYTATVGSGQSGGRDDGYYNYSYVITISELPKAEVTVDWEGVPEDQITESLTLTFSAGRGNNRVSYERTISSINALEGGNWYNTYALEERSYTLTVSGGPENYTAEVSGSFYDGYTVKFNAPITVKVAVVHGSGLTEAHKTALENQNMTITFANDNVSDVEKTISTNATTTTDGQYEFDYIYTMANPGTNEHYTLSVSGLPTSPAFSYTVNQYTSTVGETTEHIFVITITEEQYNVGDGDSRGSSYGHIDVKVDGSFTVYIDGQPVNLSGEVDKSTLSVKIGTDDPVSLSDANTQTEDGRYEYTENVNGLYASDIDWVGTTFYMSNVYVNGRLYIDLSSYSGEILTLLQSLLEYDATGYEGKHYYYLFENYQYEGIQECTNGNGMRSHGNSGTATGLDLYITASKLAEEVMPNDTIRKVSTGPLPDGLEAYPVAAVSIYKVTESNGSYTLDRVWSGNLTSGADAQQLGTVLTIGKYIIVEHIAGGYDYTMSLSVEGVTKTEITIDGTTYQGFEITSTDAEADIVLVLTNTYAEESLDIHVTKVWDDNNNQDGKRPDSIQVELYANGNKVTVDADDDAITNPIILVGSAWEGSWLDLPKEANGAAIQYTVKEIGATTTDGKTTITFGEDGDYGIYAVAYDGDATNGFTVTNSYPAEKTEATVKKVWDDANNQDGKRPTALTVILTGKVGENTVSTETVTLNGTNNWTATVKNLPKYADGGVGQEIQYTWTEGTLPEGYKLTSTSTEGTITTLTNTHVPEVTSATVKKVWDDANNQDGKRPDSLTVTLSNGDTVTLSDENNWEATIDNLPKYNAGQEIKYTWTETVPEGYELTSTSTEGTITTLTNSYAPEMTEATVTKVWNDANNQDGKRPETLTVTLSNGQTVTLNEANGWTATVKDLPKYANGVEIQYTWTEDTLPDGYTLESTSVNGTVTTLTNKYTPEVVDITVEKDWVIPQDLQNAFLTYWKGESVTATIALLKNGVEYNRQNLTAVTFVDGTWSYDGGRYTWEDIPKYEKGKLINWTVVEIITDDDIRDNFGITTVWNSETNTYTVTNTYDPNYRSAMVVKDWEDSDNIAGFRPTSIEVQLYQSIAGGTLTLVANNDSGTGIDGVVQLNEDNDWTYIWTGLPQWTNPSSDTDKGSAITYKVKEVFIPDRYDGDPDDDNNIAEANEEIWGTSIVAGSYAFTLTNYHTPETTEATVKKVWDDANNQDGKRPDSLTVTLSNGTEVTLSKENGWTATVKDLPKYANGVEIQYTWTEDTLPEGYELTNTSVNGTVTTLTNSYTPEMTEATVTKVWNDANNQDGKRPETLTVTLSNGQTVTLNEANGWTATVKDLPKYANGVEIQYTWTEGTLPEGYKLTSTSTEGTITTLTNTHVPEVTSATVKKVWDDANNQDGKRPDSLTVTLSNGDTVTLSDENNWEATIDNLPKYNAGQEIKYTWTETVPEGYELTSTVTVGTVTKLTNTHTPETINIDGTKVWDDNSDQDGKRPDSILIYLYKIVGSTRTFVESQTVTGQTDNWSFQFTDLPKYEDGVEIDYRLAESNEIDDLGYSTTVVDTSNTQKIITNKRTPETLSVRVKKSWTFAPNNGTITLPSSAATNPVKVQLLKDNQVYLEAKVLEWEDGTPNSVDTSILQNSVTYHSKEVKWENLPKYEEGKEIIWDIVEYLGDYANEYAISQDVSKDENGNFIITLTNTYDPTHRSLLVNKVWDDNHNQEGMRPEEIAVQLEFSVDGNNWYNVPNKDNPETDTHVTLAIDENGAPTNADEFFTAFDGQVILKNIDVGAQADGSHQLDWGYLWYALPQYHNNDQETGNAIQYRVREVLTEVTDNNKIISAAWVTNYNYPGKDTTDDTDDGLGTSMGTSITTGSWAYTITNTRELETISISGTKDWENYNHDALLPDSITVELYANGSLHSKKVVTADSNGDWAYSFENLPKYKDGTEITYTVKEAPVNGYTVSYGEGKTEATVENGKVSDITNTLDTVSINVTKYWRDQGYTHVERPESITVKLLADGEYYSSQTMTGATVDSVDNWTCEFENLPKYRKGTTTPIVYSIVEELVAGYNEPVYTPSGGVVSIGSDNIGTAGIVNSVAVVNIRVKKVWVDDEDAGIRPESITLGLYAGDSLVMKQDSSNTAVPVIAEAKSPVWGHVFEGVPEKDANGQDIVYTVKEIEKNVDGEWIEKAPAGYTSVAGQLDNGYTITNTLETVDITVNKIWNDGNYKYRPSTITVKLMNGETEVDSAVIGLDGNNPMTGTTVSADGNTWSYTFKDLPKYGKNSEGKVAEIQYTVKEIVEDGYTNAYGTGSDKTVINITNTLIENKITIKKVWNGPVAANSVKVNVVFRNDIVETVELKASDDWKLDYNWKGSLNGLTFTEVDVPSNYASSGSDVIAKADGDNAYAVTITNTYIEPDDPDYDDDDDEYKVIVKKVWVGGDEENRPDVEIQLYRNGRKYRDAATLKESKVKSKNWRYVWEDVNDNEDTEWSVKEVEVPAGYKSEVTKVRDNYFIVTNTWVEEKETPYTGA